jgi:hypothetical protein
MAKKKKKQNLTKGVFKELGRRASSEAAGRQEFAKSNLISRLESLIPERLRWLFPFIEDFRPSKEEDDEEATLIHPLMLRLSVELLLVNLSTLTIAASKGIH